MFRSRNIENLVLAAIVTGLFLCEAASGQTVERVISVAGNQAVLKQPFQVTVSPSGALLAITDRQAGRIYIFDSRGELQWGSSESLTLDQPSGICFGSEETVFFTLKDKLILLGLSKSTPDKVDTVADMSAASGKLKSVDRIQPEAGGYLVLDESRNVIARFDRAWKFDRVIVESGQGKGRLWSPTDFALDLSGNILVADAGNYAVQCFASDGQFLFYGGWNAPSSQRTWEASAIFVSLQEVIWAADAGSRQWRLFDKTGNEIQQIPFPNEIIRPRSIAVTPDNRIAVADESGSIVLLSLP